MAGITCNIAKGREVEFYERVNSNDPANSALIMGLMVAGGDLSAMQDVDTLSALLALTAEVSVGGYARKTLTDADLAAWAPNDTTNQTTLVLPLQTFASLVAGQTVGYVYVAYDSDTTGGTDTNIVPVTVADYLIDGTNAPTLGDDLLVDYSSGWVIAS